MKKNSKPKFTPYGKLSKKKKRELDKLRRKTWGALDPVTRRAGPHKAYDRAKEKEKNFIQNFGDGSTVPDIFFKLEIAMILPRDPVGIPFFPRRTRKIRPFHAVKKSF